MSLPLNMSQSIRRSPSYQIADRPTSPLASPRSPRSHKSKKSHKTKSEGKEKKKDRSLRSKSTSPRTIESSLPQSHSASSLNAIHSLNASPLRQSGYSSAGLINEVLISEGTGESSDSFTSEDSKKSDKSDLSEVVQIIVEWRDPQGYKHRIPHHIWVEQYKSIMPDFQNKCAWCQVKYGDDIPFCCECNSYIFCQIECYSKFAHAMDHECQSPFKPL